jgi:hypothetical protein
MLRSVLLGLAILLVGAAAPAPANAQAGYDRPGGDYSHFQVANGDPASCATRCEHDARCRAWSFSYPGTVGTTAMCWLKREVRPRVKATCCVSGVRGAGVIEPRVGKLEYSIDRYGGDYRAFETKPDPKGKPCADACEADNKCRAWTYRRQGYGAPVARCFLKDEIKPPRHRPCCISGVVR